MAIAVLSSDPEPNPKKKADELKGGGDGGEEDELSEVSVKGSSNEVRVSTNGWVNGDGGGGVGVRVLGDLEMYRA